MLSKGYRGNLLFSVFSGSFLCLLCVWQWLNDANGLLTGLYFTLTVLYIGIQGYDLVQAQRFNTRFQAYVTAFHLTPEKLASVMGNSPYDYGYDRHGQLEIYFMSWRQRNVLLAKLRETYGEVVV